MSDHSEMQKYVREFVYKFKHDGFTPKEDIIVELQLVDLPFEISAFEKAEAEQPKNIEEDSNYIYALEKLNHEINMVIGTGALVDNLTIKNLKECEGKRSELENQLKGLRSLNTQLAEDKIKIENVIRDIFKEYSAIRDKFKDKLPIGFFDDDPPESEITRG